MYLSDNTSITQTNSKPLCVYRPLWFFLCHVVKGDWFYLLPSYILVPKIHDFSFPNRNWTRMKILLGKYAVIIHFIKQIISK